MGDALKVSSEKFNLVLKLYKLYMFDLYIGFQFNFDIKIVFCYLFSLWFKSGEMKGVEFWL